MMSLACTSLHETILVLFIKEKRAFSLGSFGVFVLSTVSFSLPQLAEVAGKAFLRSILC